MDAKEFWCRAFLAAMRGSYSTDVAWENHGAPAAYCEAAADAALEVARRRGMVTGERTASGAPEIERVGFMATQDPDNPGWCLVDIRNVGVFKVPNGCASFGFNGTVYRVSWAETMPPKPAEVWIERPANGGA